MDEFKDQFKKCTNKKELRLKIASRLREEGFTRNEAQIKKKIEHLTSQIKLPIFDGHATNFNEWINMFDALFNHD